MLDTQNSSSPAQDQFVALLREMFQIEDLDLDFGIYRVLNQERALIKTFLDERIGPLTREALGAADDTQRDALEKELARLAKTLEDAGVAPDSSPKYADLKRQLDALGTSGALETEVYNGLCDFFGRYYDSGDFLSRPRYRKDVYALPYNGEEVKLHWANRDQYYIKSTQVLEAFEWNCNGQKVRFQLREAGAASDNNKEDRRFVLALDENESPVVHHDSDILVVEFDFKKVSGGRRDLNADADKRLRDWEEGQKLVAPLLAPFNDKKSLFLHRLNSWTARGSFDFFVHKDLRGFLARELDFYLKNEVLHLDALLDGDTGAWEKSTLSKARAMHALGTKIIEFLASLEELQKRLWEKQKWVTQSRAIVPLALIPDTMQADVLRNEAQTAEWKTLYGVGTEPVSTVNPVAWSEPPSADWAASHVDIAVDTQYFDAAWTRRLWSELSKEHTLDELWNGALWNADNFAALNLMQKRFREQVKCIYIDPPYNTDVSELLYKNGYKHSTWLAMIQDRQELSKYLLHAEGICCVTIDDYEYHRLQGILLDWWGQENYLATVLIRNNPSGRSTVKGFAINHEYAVFYAKSEQAEIGRMPHSKEQIQRYGEVEERDGKKLFFEWENLRKSSAGSNRADRPKQFYPIYWDRSTGRLRVPEMAWNERTKDWKILGQPVASEIEILPFNSAGVEKVWSLGHERVREEAASFKVVTNDTTEIYKRKYLNEAGTLPRTWWDNPAYSARDTGTATIADFFGAKEAFLFPKSVVAVMDCLRVQNAKSDSLILDYFAGSGTTGHAVINLNRTDGEDGRRKYLLVEMGKYFDTVLVPRLKKAAFAVEWKDGRPADFAARNGVPQTLFVYRLESYEDALEHLAAVVQADGQTSITAPDDEWTVRYALGASTRDGELPLSDELFAAPFEMQMQIGGDKAGQSTSVTLDAVATFNWLLGLRVHKLWFPTEKLAAVCGLLPDDRAVVIVWRQLAGEAFEDADTALLEFWQNDPILAVWRQDHDVETVYLNGDSTLWRSKTRDETWISEPLEEEFRALMFTTSPHREAF